jgi:hypothetical protein
MLQAPDTACGVHSAVVRSPVADAVFRLVFRVHSRSHVEIMCLRQSRWPEDRGFARLRAEEPCTNAVSRPGPRSPARDRTITSVQTLGRRRWKKASGYHRQARVENAFFRYKSIIGDGLRARHAKVQEIEASIACNILNRMTELGRPASFAIGS